MSSAASARADLGGTDCILKISQKEVAVSSDLSGKQYIYFSKFYFNFFRIEVTAEILPLSVLQQWHAQTQGSSSSKEATQNSRRIE